MEEKSKRGGYRPGAGRKPTGSTKNITTNFRLSEKSATALARLAKEKGISRNEAVNLWLESLYND